VTTFWNPRLLAILHGQNWFGTHSLFAAAWDLHCVRTRGGCCGNTINVWSLSDWIALYLDLGGIDVHFDAAVADRASSPRLATVEAADRLVLGWSCSSS